MEFSIIVSILIAVLVVGIATLVVGCVLMMPKVGRHWWEGLIPGYNFYLLFRGARCEVLLAAYIIDAAFVFGFFFADDPVVQDMVWWPVLFGVLMFQWMALCLAQRMHLAWPWQLLSFVAPSFAWCLIGLLPERVDPRCYPWAVRPFLHFEHTVWSHPWEYDENAPDGEESQEEPIEDDESEYYEDEEPVEEDFEDGSEPYDDGSSEVADTGVLSEVGDFAGEESDFETEPEPELETEGETELVDESWLASEVEGEPRSEPESESLVEADADLGRRKPTSAVPGDRPLELEADAARYGGGRLATTGFMGSPEEPESWSDFESEVEARFESGLGAVFEPGLEGEVEEESEPDFESALEADAGMRRRKPTSAVHGDETSELEADAAMYGGGRLATTGFMGSPKEQGFESEPEPEPEFEPDLYDEYEDEYLEEPQLVEDVPVETADMGNSEDGNPSEGSAMSAYEDEEPMAAEPEEPEEPEEIPAEDRYEDEPAYHGSGFDPEGDEAVEEADEHEPSRFSEHIEKILNEEAELFDRKPRSAMRHGRPDDDLSDLVEGQIEGVYAEQLGYPGVTQDVDAEEAAYLEENATYARERVLEETHDEPDAGGYVGKHLAAAVRQVQEEARTDSDWPEPERQPEVDAETEAKPEVEPESQPRPKPQTGPPPRSISRPDTLPGRRAMSDLIDKRTPDID